MAEGTLSLLKASVCTFHLDFVPQVSSSIMVRFYVLNWRILFEVRNITMLSTIPEIMGRPLFVQDCSLPVRKLNPRQYIADIPGVSVLDNSS